MELPKYDKKILIYLIFYLLKGDDQPQTEAKFMAGPLR